LDIQGCYYVQRLYSELASEMIFVLSSDEEDSGSGRRPKHAQNQDSKPKPKVPNGSEADDTDDASRYCFFRYSMR